jgi:hypothetical protein
MLTTQLTKTRSLAQEIAPPELKKLADEVLKQIPVSGFVRYPSNKY